MITSTKFDKKYQEDIVWGLVFGLVGGLIWGLILGLVWGLVGGLVWGLAIILINFKEALPFLSHIFPIAILILGIILIVELMFIFDKSKPSKKENIFWFTCKRKLENTFEVLLALSGIAQIYIFIREGSKYLTQEIINEIIKWFGYIGIGVIGIAVIVGLFYIWIKLNSLKYEK